MVDLITFGIVGIVVILIFIRKTSAGVAVLCLLAGVLLDQMLSKWVIEMLPPFSGEMQQYVEVVVRLLVMFTAPILAMAAVKAPRQNMVLTLLTSLILGFLIVLFGTSIAAQLTITSNAVKNAGLIHFLDPYKNAILAGSAILAIVEMIATHHKPLNTKKSK